MTRLTLSLALLAGFLLAARAAWRWCELTEQRESLNTESET